MVAGPWWDPSEDDLAGWDGPLPGVIRLAPDYSAELPLWGEGFGNIAWQFTKFSPGLLDRLAAWQRAFDENFRWDSGWRSSMVKEAWAREAKRLETDVRAELGSRAELDVDLWPLGSSKSFRRSGQPLHGPATEQGTGRRARGARRRRTPR